MKIRLTVNGSELDLDVEPLSRLVDVIRDDLGLVASKIGCGEGECGACNILIDGETTTSCLVPVVQAEGCEIITLEGLIDSGDWDIEILRRLFARFDAAQCGACTPGILMTCLGSIKKTKATRLSRDEIRFLLGGNLCRCTGYEPIVRAVQEWANTEHER